MAPHFGFGIALEVFVHKRRDLMDISAQTMLKKILRKGGGGIEMNLFSGLQQKQQSL